MISTPKTVLVADDEPAVRRLLQRGLRPHLPDFDIASVANGQEAIDYLGAHPVEVLVTDIHMPVKDGFEVLAYVRKRHPNLAVVVLAAMAPEAVVAKAPELGAFHVVQKPASADLVARHVLAARAESARGRMNGVPLPTVLRLMRAERKTCSLLVRSGDEKGRLHFLSGELVNAYSFQLGAEGEEAARRLLALDDVTIDFERSLHNHVRRIHTPLEALLLEVATQLDEAARDPTAPHDAGARRPARPRASLDDALTGLHTSLVDLRTRADGTARLLDGAAPAFGGAVEALARAPRTTSERHRRLDAARAEVASLAARLIRAVDELAVAPGAADG